jgi:hypothetical protein
MAIGVKVGREATHGTIAASFSSLAANFSSKLRQRNMVLDEGRNGQDIDFSYVTGPRNEEWQISDSFIYHDTIGHILASALGTPTKTIVDTIFDNTFKLADDPKSLSFQWTQPRRVTQSFQALYGVVDKLTITFDINGNLTYAASGIAMGRTDIAAPTFTFSAVKPFSAWAGVVTLSGSAAGAYADLLKGSITITRNRKPFHTIRNNRDPRLMTIGDRTVEVDLTVDFDSIDEFDDFRNGIEDLLLIKWTDVSTTIGTTSNPEFEVSLPRLFYEDAGEDVSTDLPTMNLKGKAIYSSGAASSIVVRVKSNVDYTL